MNKNSLSIVILAAGKGTRMKSNTPKVLHRICGREMLYYSIKESLKLSNDVCVILGFEAERIKEKMQEYFGDKIRFALTANCLFYISANTRSTTKQLL